MTSKTFFFLFIPILAIILLAVNLIFAPHNPYQEKDSAFECGFHSFLGQNRTQFSISFFIFGLLFLLFDLEILVIYPYVVSAHTNGIYGLAVALLFFLALTLGFAFELGKNALKIDSRQMVTLNNHNPNKVYLLSSVNIVAFSLAVSFNTITFKLSLDPSLLLNLSDFSSGLPSIQDVLNSMGNLKPFPGLNSMDDVRDGFGVLFNIIKTNSIGDISPGFRLNHIPPRFCHFYDHSLTPFILGLGHLKFVAIPLLMPCIYLIGTTFRGIVEYIIHIIRVIRNNLGFVQRGRFTDSPALNQRRQQQRATAATRRARLKAARGAQSNGAGDGDDDRKEEDRKNRKFYNDYVGPYELLANTRFIEFLLNLWTNASNSYSAINSSRVPLTMPNLDFGHVFRVLGESTFYVRTILPQYLPDLEAIVALSGALLALNYGGITDVDSGLVTFVVNSDNGRLVVENLFSLIEHIESLLDYLYPTWGDATW